jgi:hypothetical protein
MCPFVRLPRACAWVSPHHAAIMIILDIPRPFDGSTITIPLYHRGHVALFPDTTIWSCLLPGAPRNGTLAELVISPVDFDAWNELYRISGTFRDRPGLVHDILHTLRDFDINVLTAESSSMARQQQHSIELIVDAHSYTRHSLDSEHDAMAEVRRALLARVFDDVQLSDRNEPRLKISRVRHLQQASLDYTHAAADHRRSRGPRPAYGPVHVEHPRPGKVVISLSADQQAALADALKSADGNSDRLSYHYLLVSETGDRFLRAYFISDAEPIIWARLKHAEEMGALAAITGAMVCAGFNILTSLARLHHHRQSAEFEVVLQARNSRGMGREVLQARLEAALSTAEVCDHRVELSCYPRGYGHPEDRGNLLKPVPEQHRLALLDAHEEVRPRPIGLRPPRLKTTDEILGEKVQQYEAKCGRAVYARDDPARLDLARELLRQGAGVLFVSHHFQNDGLIGRITNSAGKRGMKVVHGGQLNHGIHRDRIIERMSGCTHFLGIWTPEGGKQVSSDPATWWPSPWMHWELGAAQTLGLTWHLLIDDSIDEGAWQRVTADNTHTIFTEKTLKVSMKRAVKILSGAPPRVGRSGTGPRAGAGLILR